MTDTAAFKPTPVFREKRRARLFKLELHDSRDQRIDIVVRDVSAHGLSAAARTQPPAINEVVRARLADGTVLWGIVRWVEDNLFGVEFDVSPQASEQPHDGSPGVPARVY